MLATALFVEHHTSCAIYCRQGILKNSRIATTDTMLGGFDSALNAGSRCTMGQSSNPTPAKKSVGKTGGFQPREDFRRCTGDIFLVRRWHSPLYPLEGRIDIEMTLNVFCNTIRLPEDRVMRAVRLYGLRLYWFSIELLHCYLAASVWVQAFRQ